MILVWTPESCYVWRGGNFPENPTTGETGKWQIPGIAVSLRLPSERPSTRIPQRDSPWSKSGNHASLAGDRGDAIQKGNVSHLGDDKGGGY